MGRTGPGCHAAKEDSPTNDAPSERDDGLRELPCAYDPEGYDLDRALASVERGWRPLVHLAWRLVPPGWRIVQVKPKGGLRIYLQADREGTRLPPEWPRGALREISEQTCELCGDQGASVRADWWVLCEEHWTRRQQGQEPPGQAEGDALDPRLRRGFELVRRELIDDLASGLLLLPEHHELLDLADELLGTVPWYEEAWSRSATYREALPDRAGYWAEAEAVLRRLRDRGARTARSGDEDEAPMGGVES